MKITRKTSDGKKGGLFVGKSHAKGGIPAIVVDTGQPIEVEGGEAIINKEATKKYWKQLSSINQSAGNGNPIPPPTNLSDNPDEYRKGGKISKIAIMQGTKHELEHSDTIKSFSRTDVSVKEIARKIAIDHLKENPNYYKILAKIKLAKGGEVVCRSCSNSWLKHHKAVGMNVFECDKCGNNNHKFYKGGATSDMSPSELKKFYASPEGKKLDAETHAEWKRLVNMTKSELQAFYDSEEGKTAGLSKAKANELGIDNGRTSARWILKMKDIPYTEWTSQMWIWAKKQISFIKRMSKNRGSLYEANGKKTRKYLSLLIWGHNPEKYKNGGQLDNLIIGKTYTGKEIRDIVSKYDSQEGTDMNQFSKDYINVKDKYVFDYANVQKLIQRDSDLKAFIDDEYDPKIEIDFQTIDTPILLGNGLYAQWQENVVLDGYHRILQALYNKDVKIPAFFKLNSEGKISTYAKGGQTKEIQEKNRGGNCFEIAGKIAMATPETLKSMGLPKFHGTPYVVHAQVIGQGDIEGVKYGHAWVEDDLFVYDFSNGRKIVFPKELYYLLGGVETKKPIYFKYEFWEARKLMLDTGHYGSWGLITESGL